MPGSMHYWFELLRFKITRASDPSEDAFSQYIRKSTNSESVRREHYISAVQSRPLVYLRCPSEAGT